MALIEFHNVSKQFGTFTVVEAVSLEIHRGETLVLLGSSGSGKTTVLKMMNRLVDLSSGQILLEGRDIRLQDPIALRRSMGYVIQGSGLFPHMTVTENITLVPRLLGWGRSRQQSRAEELLQLVGLVPQDMAQRYPDELSGGQQQRIGVARALAANPETLLMDEPFGALDAVTRELLQLELLRLKQRLQKTIVFVTHDIFEALTLADRIAILHNGRLEQIGTPTEIIRHPASPFVEALLAAPKKQLQTFQNALS
ncbi:MAG: ATP-binding cassette domain-containing protein [Cyanobacteria bacterium P01_G01_bin.54]